MYKSIRAILLVIFCFASLFTLPANNKNNNAEPIDDWLKDFVPGEMIKIGPSWGYLSLGAYLETVDEISNVHIVIEEGTYLDKHLYIRAENVIIEGIGDVNLLCTELYENVLEISGSNILVKNIRMKHFNPGNPETQNCTGRVVMFDHAENVIIDNCDLNGCGLAGLHDNLGNANILVRNCYIHNNSLGAYTNIEGDVWQEEINNHPVFVFENNRIENNGENRVREADDEDEALIEAALQNKRPEINYMENEKELWKDVANPLIVKYKGSEFGDYFHLLFDDENHVRYDFGFGDNNYGEYTLYEQPDPLLDNPKYLNRTFELHWEWKLTTFPCCDGGYELVEGYQPSIVKLKLISTKK